MPMAITYNSNFETCQPGSELSIPQRKIGIIGPHGQQAGQPPSVKKGQSTGMHSRNPSFLAQFIAGGFGGVGSILAGHPLETVKVRLQTQPMTEGKPLLYRGTWDCAKKIVKHEGIRGLFKGMFVPILVVSPRLAVAFWSYQVGKQLQTPRGNSGEFAPHQLFLAGALSGLFAATFMIPSERIKCLLQVQDVSSVATKYTNSFDCARQIYNKAGIFRGTYCGSLATLIRDVPYAGMYFMTYEQLKKAFSSKGQSHDGWMIIRVIFSGGTAGVVSWSVAIAPDTIKSIIQSEPAVASPSTCSMKSVFLELMRKDGPGAFFKGLTPSLLGAFPANAACFGAYELSMEVLTWCGV